MFTRSSLCCTVHCRHSECTTAAGRRVTRFVRLRVPPRKSHIGSYVHSVLPVFCSELQALGVHNASRTPSNSLRETQTESHRENLTSVAMFTRSSLCCTVNCRHSECTRA